MQQLAVDGLALGGGDVSLETDRHYQAFQNRKENQLKFKQIGSDFKSVIF